jgi:diguanylate cyclase (GGDEF) domain
MTNISAELVLTIILMILIALLVHKLSLKIAISRRTRELEEANEKLEELSVTDSLTGLKNRRYFGELMSNFNGLDRVGLLILDIDNFKAINDRFGHNVGDCVIQYVAEILKRVSKNGEIIARIGGEEFAVITRFDCFDTANDYAHDIVTLIEKSTPFFLSDPERVTVSVGLRYYNTKTQTLTLEEADALLYRAKREGKNKVVAEYD